MQSKNNNNKVQKQEIVKITVVSENQESQNIKIDNKEYKLTNPHVMDTLVLEFDNMLACEGALLRFIAMSQLTCKRMEITESMNGVDVSQITCTDKYIDEFDIAIKMRLIRIDQDISLDKQFMLHAINSTTEDLIVTTDFISPKINCNKHILCQLKPGKEIKFPINIIEGNGQQHTTFIPFSKLVIIEDPSLSKLDYNIDYYKINKQILTIQSNNSKPNKQQYSNKWIINQALDDYKKQLSPDNIIRYRFIAVKKNESIIQYANQSFQFGNVIHMMIPLVRDDVICTVTNNNPNYIGVILRFASPVQKELIQQILLDVATYQSKKYSVSL